MMAKKRKINRYTAKQIQFVAEKITGRSYADMHLLFNKRFKLSITFGQMKSLLRHHGLCNGFGHGNPTIPRERKYQDEHIRFLKKNVAGRSYADLAIIFNKKYGFSLSARSLHTLLSRYNLSNGRDCRFPPGHVPANKGKKGYCSPGSEKGWFRPGHPGYKINERAVGSERINADGYVEIKISDKPVVTAQQRQKRWRHKHVVIWEKANGPVPQGHVVIFADGNKMNMKLKNLILITRRELAVLNHMGLISKNGDVTKTAVYIARLKILTADRKRNTFKTVKKKSVVIIDNTGKRIFITQEPRTKKFITVRETRRGQYECWAKALRPRRTIEEAQRQLLEYAQKRGWHRT